MQVSVPVPVIVCELSLSVTLPAASVMHEPLPESVTDRVRLYVPGFDAT
jgi:hypothetical protein